MQDNNEAKGAETITETVAEVTETVTEAAETAAENKIEIRDIDKDKKKNEKIDKNGKKKMNSALEWVLVIAGAVAIALFLNFVILINSVVPSGSMESTIMTGSRMFGLRVVYWFSDPQRGDIVVFKYPVNPKKNFVKRVIGIPGDVVEIKAETAEVDGVTQRIGVVYVNGEALDEPYLNETMLPPAQDLRYEVPEGCYFMMGDNRNNSNDSRYWEITDENGNKTAAPYVTRDAILGKALFCYWPLNRIGVLK